MGKQSLAIDTKDLGGGMKDEINLCSYKQLVKMCLSLTSLAPRCCRGKPMNIYNCAHIFRARECGEVLSQNVVLATATMF